MAAQIPDSRAVEKIVAVLDSAQVPGDAELHALLDCPALKTGLDHSQLWTLICLSRHIDRQKWVGYVVETRLKGDLAKLGTAGSLGHPDDIPQSGDVPDEPGWHYYFHGKGCCLSHESDGTTIDVDFTDEGASDRIDRFFYSRFLEDLKRPELPERLLQRKEPLEHAWQANIDSLVCEECLDAKRGIHVMQIGKDLAERLDSILAHMIALAATSEPCSSRRLVFAALSLGDVLLVQQSAESANLGEELTLRISRAAAQAKQRRSDLLVETLRTTSSGADSCRLAALADLGSSNAKSVVTECVFRTPVDGIANKALAILVSWNDQDLLMSLQGLLEHRFSQSFGLRSIARTLVSGRGDEDRQPREYQIVRAVTALLQRWAVGTLKAELCDKIVALLESSVRANSGEAALLLYCFDHNRGLNRLKAALLGKIPAAHSDAAAACVLLGTPETKQILAEALNNSSLQIQHAAACALKRFPSADARELAAKWWARFDGIDSPQGKEVSIGGKTITAYPMDEVMHANMEMFFSGTIDRLRKDFGLILAQSL